MERIIVSNSLNSTDFLRTIAKRGHKELGLYVYKEIDVLHYILDKNGLAIDKEYISKANQAYTYMRLLSYKYQDACNVRDAINSYRDSYFGEVDFNKLNDNFKKKKNIIIDAYDKYVNYKKENNLYDDIDLINFINDNIKDKLDTECIIFNELPLSNLCSELVGRLLNVKQLPINTYLGGSKPNISVVKAFGKTNEVDYVFNEILDKRLGDCEIVMLSTEYLPYILEYTSRYNIKYTSQVGIPVGNTNSGKLLKCILKMKENHYDKNSYVELFKCSAFDNSSFKKVFSYARRYNDFINYLGWLRLGFGSKNNTVPNVYDDKDIYEELSILASDVNKGIPYFINKYARIDGYNEAIYERLIEMEASGLDELYEVFLTSNINQRISSNDSIHITTLTGAFNSLRPNVFILGLDSSFPGSPQENYFIYDDEYEIDKYKSINVINDKKKMLLSFIDLCDNCYLSYSYFKPAEMHEENPSSIIYDMKAKPIDYRYNSGRLSNNNLAINSYINNYKHERIVDNDLSLDDYKTILLNKKYSPSMFYKALIEEERESFILNVLFDSNVDRLDDPYNIIDDNYKGTVIHALFEGFEKNKISKEEIEKKANEEFDKFLLMKPALITSKVEEARLDFVSLVGKLYDMMTDNTHVLSEVTISKTDVYGLCFGGQFDRLEKDKDGNYILIDYKTGRNVKHLDNDPITCVQGLIYAYLIENGKDMNGNYITDNGKRITISECQFLYPVLGRPISIKWNDETKEKLESLIKGVIDDINTGEILKYTRTPKSKGIYDNEILYSLISKVEI